MTWALASFAFILALLGIALTMGALEALHDLNGRVRRLEADE